MNNTHLNINYIQHMNAFCSLLHEQAQLSSCDVSLYVALFHLWNLQHFPELLVIDKAFVKKISKIGSNRTYIKCLKQLHDCGLIIYQPPAAPFKPSVISMLPLSKKAPHTAGITAPHMVSDNTPHVKCTIAHHTGAKVHSFYNNKHINLNKTECQTARTQVINGKEPVILMVPAQEDVRRFFSAAGHPETEADKFYFHYQAIGWKLSGQPITNWQAAAIKWFGHIPSLQKNNHAHTTTTNNVIHTDKNKCYDEPF